MNLFCPLIKLKGQKLFNKRLECSKAVKITLHLF